MLRQSGQWSSGELRAWVWYARQGDGSIPRRASLPANGQTLRQEAKEVHAEHRRAAFDLLIIIACLVSIKDFVSGVSRSSSVWEKRATPNTVLLAEEFP